MNVYTSIDFEGVWPIGAAAVIVAENEDEAQRLLWGAMRAHGLHVSGGESVDLVDTSVPHAEILVDGDY